MPPFTPSAWPDYTLPAAWSQPFSPFFAALLPPVWDTPYGSASDLRAHTRNSKQRRGWENPVWDSRFISLPRILDAACPECGFFYLHLTSSAKLTCLRSAYWRQWRNMRTIISKSIGHTRYYHYPVIQITWAISLPIALALSHDHVAESVVCWNLTALHRTDLHWDGSLSQREVDSGWKSKIITLCKCSMDWICRTMTSDCA